MLEKQRLVTIYEKIQKVLFSMIPEKWQKICLYASMIEQVNGLQTGEMFFYYYPKGVIKKNPINVYEIPLKFGIEEEHYMRLADNLYFYIKELRKEFVNAKQKLWTNITILIEGTTLKIEYHYEDLIGSPYSSYDRHIIWKCQYLSFPMERLTKKERNMVEKYWQDYMFIDNTVKIDTTHVYQKNIQHTIEYNKIEAPSVQEEIKPKVKEKKIKSELSKREEKVVETPQKVYGNYKKENKEYGKYEQRKTLQQRLIEKYEKGKQELPKEEHSSIQQVVDNKTKKKNQILNF